MVFQTLPCVYSLYSKFLEVVQRFWRYVEVLGVIKSAVDVCFDVYFRRSDVGFELMNMYHFSRISRSNI